MKKHNTFLFFIWIGIVLQAVSSCDKEDEDESVDDTSASRVETARALHVFPGINRVKLSWELPDAPIAKAVVYWSASDSVEVRNSGESKTMEVYSGYLEEKNHSFIIYLYDSKGNRSAGAKIVTHVYGENYIGTLPNRLYDDAIYENGQVRISWGSPYTGYAVTDIRYEDSTGSIDSVQISGQTNTSVLENYKPGTWFEFRSGYKPVSEAIDTFYTAYESALEKSKFMNPLLMSKGADPWVYGKDGMYYFTHTTGGSIQLYPTRKMSRLANSTPIEIWRPPSGTMYSYNLWAPEIHFLNNKWYVYFAADNGTNSNHRMYVIENSSADPLAGQWVFKGKLADPTDQWAIDGTILEYKNQLYMVWSGSAYGAAPQNLYIARMSSPYELVGSRVMISTPVYNWEKNGAAINEGPQVLKNKEGEVFIIYSGSGYWTDDYCLGMLTLKPDGDPMKPADWIKNPEPVFTRNDAGGAFGPGHCSFFKSRDETEDWIAYHARLLPNGGDTNYRNVRIQKFGWDTAGIPDFGRPVNVSERLYTPSGEF